MATPGRFKPILAAAATLKVAGRNPLSALAKPTRDLAVEREERGWGARSGGGSPLQGLDTTGAARRPASLLSPQILLFASRIFTLPSSRPKERMGTDKRERVASSQGAVHGPERKGGEKKRGATRRRAATCAPRRRVQASAGEMVGRRRHPRRRTPREIVAQRARNEGQGLQSQRTWRGVRVAAAAGQWKKEKRRPGNEKNTRKKNEKKTRSPVQRQKVL